MSDQTLKASAIPATERLARSEVQRREAAQVIALRQRRRGSIWTGLIYVFLVIMLIFALFPIYFVIQASLRGDQTLYTTDLQIFPEHPTLSNYQYVFTEIPFLSWVGNTIFVCGLATLLGLIFATTGAYALSRFRFRGRQLTLVILLAIQAFPQLLALLAYYLLLQTLGIIDNAPLLGLAVVYAGGSIVFSCWNIKGYFDTLPVELEQAAMVDGATHTQAFLRVTLPLAAPALAASALFIFIGGWSEFPIANILLNSNATGSNLTFPVGIYGLQNDFRTPWGYFAAASVLVAVPVSIAFLYLQRFFQSGLTIGSVKG